MSNSDSEKFIHVSQVLDNKPRLGPIPGEQVLPWGIISITSFILTQGLFGLGFVPTGLIAIWGCSSWWVLTGDGCWKFLGKFYPTPKWVSGHFTYQSIWFAGDDENENTSKRKGKFSTRKPDKKSGI